ncbi:MAG: DNA repair protein RecN, partial [Ignavibacteria bacterium]|nr:DNA repair protein RecN [Ignavibacteria bacterium]
MLRHLSISNYALIDNIEIEFFDGFITITGETGAGKSIILDALSLILGQRADTQTLMDKKRKCIVEVEIIDKNQNAIGFFNANNLDYDKNIIIRREINPEGKSRAFINDTPVSLNLLKDLGDLLIDIHSQHQTRLLNDLNFQLLAIDSFAGISELTKQYTANYLEYCDLKKLHQNLLEEEKKFQTDADYYSFLFNELEQAHLKENEQQELEKELELLNHAELIKSSLHKSLQFLNDDEQNIIQQITTVQNLLSNINKFNEEIHQNYERIHSVNIELKDIVSELEKISDKINYNPLRIEEINERLNVIYRLQQKHRVATIPELIQIKNQLDRKLQSISSLESTIKKTEEQINNKHQQLMDGAQVISEKRKKASPE